MPARYVGKTYPASWSRDNFLNYNTTLIRCLRLALFVIKIYYGSSAWNRVIAGILIAIAAVMSRKICKGSFDLGLIVIQVYDIRAQSGY